jgi:ABC-type Co2+ transport system permease subunit
MEGKPGKPTDLRAKRKREQRRLFGIVAAFLVVVGSVAIGVAYGPSAVPLGLTCLAVGAGVMGLLWLILTLAEKLLNE